MGIGKYHREERKIASEIARLKTSQRVAEKRYRDLDLKIIFLKGKLNKMLHDRGSKYSYGDINKVKQRKKIRRKNNET